MRSIPTDLPQGQDRQHRTIIANSVNDLIKVRPPHDRTEAEVTAGVTPVNYAYPPGDIRRFGAADGEDCTLPIQNSIDSALVAIIPENFTAKISSTINIAAAGCTIRGKSRYTSIIQIDDAWDDAASESMISNVLQDTGTSYGATISDLYFRLYNSSGNIDAIGVDLASLNNCTISRCRFEGYLDPELAEDYLADPVTYGAAFFASFDGTGVRFAAPLAKGAYSNCVDNCNFTYMQHGVLYAGGGNHNTVRGGEFIVCAWGVHADPSSTVDSMKIIGPRFEGCDVGILEKTSQAKLIACRLENNYTCDIEFKTNSLDCLIVGALTAATATPLKNQNLASGLQIIADDLLGVYLSHSSSGRATQLIGPNVLAPNGDTGTTVNPTGISTVAAYFRAGRAVLDNNIDLTSRDSAGTGALFLIRGDTNNRVRIGAGGEEVQFHNALIDLGGGSAPTLGTIGGSGPATAAQNSWKRFYDSSGQAFYVPVWK